MLNVASPIIRPLVHVETDIWVMHSSIAYQLRIQQQNPVIPILVESTISVMCTEIMLHYAIHVPDRTRLTIHNVDLNAYRTQIVRSTKLAYGTDARIRVQEFVEVMYRKAL